MKYNELHRFLVKNGCYETGKQERDIPYGTVRKREWSSQRAITEKKK